MSNDFRYDVFLSHNTQDKPQVRRLAERLKAAGVRVWLDEWVIQAGDIIALKVDEGLEQSRVLLLCVSPAALASNWVALERSTAIHRDPGNAGRRFIPLLLGDCALPDTLRRYKYVDFRDESEAAFAEVLNTCRRETEEVPTVVVPEPEKEIRPSLVEKLVGRGRAKSPPVPRPDVRKEPVKINQKHAKLPLETEPLALFERKLTGHKSWVHAVAVLPGGKLLLSGSGTGHGLKYGDDCSVRIWDLESGETQTILEGHEGIIWQIAVAPDGKKIVSASSDSTIILWDVLTLQRLFTYKEHSNQVRAVAFFSDSRRFISASFDQSLRVWDGDSGECEKIVHVGTDIFCIAIHPDQKMVACGLRGGSLQLRSTDTYECLATLEGHSDDVNSIQIAPNGQFAVSGSDDKTVKVWDLETGVCLGTLEGHQENVMSVAFSPDGTLIASTGFTDHTVRLWAWELGECLQVIKDEPQHAFTTLSVTFSPDGSRLAVGTASHAIHIYRLTGVRPAPSERSTRRYVNAKVVLLGEGTVGKTSLAHRLIEDLYIVKDRTHGMNVWPLKLPLPPDATLEREVLLWDLAGQEDYRLIHQLFLQDAALALLLINPQRDDPFREAGDWLNALKAATGSSDSYGNTSRLLILSQVDVGGPKLSKAKLDRFCQQHGFAGWISTSAKTGENCSDKENGGQPSKLKQLIAQSIPWDKLPWTSTPRKLVEIKDAAMAMRDKTDIRLLRFAELSQRLEQALPDENFGEPDVRTAITLLANNGLVRPLRFGDLVLLRPHLLNGYAGAIVRAARAHKDEIGCVLEAKIYEPDFDFTGVERLERRGDEELLLRAIVDEMFFYNSLCIAEETPQGRFLVFPSQYRREKDIPRDPDIFVSYTFSGEWQTVWTTLVVRLWYSHEFGHKELWRNAAEFASGKGHTLGLKVDNKQGEGIATISLYFDNEVPDELKVIFIEYVHRHLARYGCEVTRDRRYVCPKCGKPVKDLDAVRQRREAKKDHITCQVCDEKVPFIDFIEQRLKSDPVARKILAMDEAATRELDTQALEQILIGHMMAITGEANQIFRPVTMFDHGIDGEVEFKDNDGKASGKRIYIQLKSGNSYLRTRKSDGSEIFDVTNERHLEYWINQPVDVYLVIRQKDELSGKQVIRWMNVTSHLKNRADKTSRQIIFAGEKLDMEALWRVRDRFFPVQANRK